MEVFIRFLHQFAPNLVPIFFFFHHHLKIKKNSLQIMGYSSRTARGKSFTTKQDEAICNACLCITQDSIIGNPAT